MLAPYKKILFLLLFNSSLFSILIIGIQNSTLKSKVNLLVDETIELPISFIIGSSLVTGSIFGSFISLNLNKKN